MKMREERICQSSLEKDNKFQNYPDPFPALLAIEINCKYNFKVSFAFISKISFVSLLQVLDITVNFKYDLQTVTFTDKNN